MEKSSLTAPWWRPLKGIDRLAIVVLTVVPLLLFGVPSLLGHPPIAADNLIQNYPLRVLVGQILRSGHLPLMNPLANSGTPLLGGMNAGAFFPTTLLFVILPGLFAWFFTIASVYICAGVGTYALARWHSFAAVPSLMAAMIFTYTGAMWGQLVHLGVVQGYALLPWLILTYLVLARQWSRESGSRRERVKLVLPATLGVAVIWALVGVSGEPRSFAEIEILTILVVPTLVLVSSSVQPTTWRQRIGFFATTGVGIGWGVVGSLSQLLPGWRFIGDSQRSAISYAFFGSGSLPPRWTLYMFMQNMVGGNGLFHQPSYFSTYNLPEVTVYATLLGFVAVTAFLLNLTRRGWVGCHREMIVYVVIGFVGLWATWGSYTKIGPLFHAIPLFGNTRLQSRNIVLVNLAMAMFAAWWFSAIREANWREAGLTPRRRWLLVWPALLSAVLTSWLLIDPNAVGQFVGVPTQHLALLHYMRPSDIAQFVVAVLTLGGVLGARRLGVRRALRVLASVLLIDIVLFIATSSTGLTSGNQPTEPSRSQAVSILGNSGRFALVDPSGASSTLFTTLGLPNTNVFTRLESIQGYGSLIDQTYSTETNTHPLYSLNPCSVVDGTVSALRLSAIVIGSSQLLATEPSSPGLVGCSAKRHQTHVDYAFGRGLQLRSISLQAPSGSLISSGDVQLRLIDLNGKTFGPWLHSSGAASITFRLPPLARLAGGYEVVMTNGGYIASANVMSTGGMQYWVTTPFAMAMASDHWRLGRTLDGASVFRVTNIHPMMWKVPGSGSGVIDQVQTSTWGDTWVSTTSTSGFALKRSVTWLPGWRATAVNAVTGQVLNLPVRRSGLIQEVSAPKGHWQIHFHYHAPYIELALASSLGGVGLMVLAFLAIIRWRPRKN